MNEKEKLNELNDEVTRRTNGEYSVTNIIYRDYKNKKYLFFTVKHNCKNCNNYEWVTNRQHFFKQNRRCPKCNNGATYTLTEFRNKVKLITGNEYTVLKKLEHGYYLFKHNSKKCENYQFKMKGSSFTGKKENRQGNRCPKCFGKKAKTHNEFVSEVYNLVGDEYTVIGTYQGAHTKIEVTHNDKSCPGYGKTFSIYPNDFLNKKPYCKFCGRTLRGEYLSEKWFIKNNIKYEKHVLVNDCRRKLPLEFDFKIINSDGTFIYYEFNGRLHYEPWDESEESFKHLKEQQERDKIKKEYCSQNNIPLVIITYKDILEASLDNYFNKKPE